jgi:hypothetical protein
LAIPVRAKATAAAAGSRTSRQDGGDPKSSALLRAAGLGQCREGEGARCRPAHRRSEDIDATQHSVARVGGELVAVVVSMAPSTGQSELSAA